MKKWLYILAGIIVTIGGIWMGIHWWLIFWKFLLGVAISFVLMAGIIILIVGFMTPSKEESFDMPESETAESEEECSQDCSDCNNTKES